MTEQRFLSYAQNMEDYHLSELFYGQSNGFYIDVGGGHCVADNVTFHFYEKGWNGIVIEPQVSLAAAYANVRPRDVVIGALAGAAPGEAVFHEAVEFHGLSTTIAANAAVSAEKGVASIERRVAVTTLASLCQAHAPEVIDILKIDVEGAEAEVLAGNDWARFRPRVIVIEAVTPWSMADASAAFEPQVLAAGYRFAFFDNLNRFYIANEHIALAKRLPPAPADWGGMDHLGEFGPPEENLRHPDHALAKALPRAILGRLNQMSATELTAILPKGIDSSHEATRAALARIAAFHDGGYVG